ncbi:pentatricopeptide (PPR) repeat-containing protein [Actinidia rufa]|uniref:Pentatricopeptide (PPR) repeat-containing protein n=1 Tax=Actinidia rufa TaxID=165716 RepID=A0A7J0DZM2_9ERIC|nr:pentatricopeptide (PPR) repeat-containing protein [Actinidia rufa]
MDICSLYSTHYSHPSPFSAPLVGKHHPTTAITTTPRLSLSLQPPTPDSDDPTTTTTSFSGDLRRPNNHKPLKNSPSNPTLPTRKIPTNPIRNLINTTNTPNHYKPLTISPSKPTPLNPLKNLLNPTNIPKPNPENLTNKLWLTSKLSPPPPPPPPPPPITPKETLSEENEIGDFEISGPPRVEFRQEGKIFVGNLPLWIKKPELAEFFRQFGPIQNVILIKGHNETDRNMGFGFVIYGGRGAEKSAMKAVDFDGVEFHGRVLTVKLDDGRRMKERSAERAKWVEGEWGMEYKSKWHEERAGSRSEFRRVLELQPGNWQSVVGAFERIKKPSRKEFGLMVNYYARRGDMHRARGTFESMRARGIEPTTHVYTNLIHAYAVGRDIEEALACVRKMKDEGIEMSLVTYSILIGGFAKVGNVE